MNKLVRNIIILVVALAVLGGGLWWVMTVEPDSGEEEQTESGSYETVYKTEQDSITAISIEQEGTSLRLVKNGDAWTAAGYNSTQISQTKVKNLVSSFSSISSDNHITENTGECGMDTPQIVVKISLSDGNTDTIKIGGKSPVLGEYFFNVNDGEIYTMSSYKAEELLKDISYYTSFSRLELTGADIYDIKIERSSGANIHLRQKDEAESTSYNTWELTEPYTLAYDANDQYVQENILTLLEELDVSTLATSASTGLSSPKAVITILSAPENEDGTRAETTTTVIKVGNTAGDKTYIEYEGAVYEVDTASLSFINTDAFLIVSKLLALVPIQSLNSMSITRGDKAYNFEVSHSAVGEEDDELSFSINGAAADEKKAKSAYQEVIGLYADGAYKGDALGDTIAEVVFSSTDFKKVITFKSINDMSASFTIDGVTEFTVKKSSLNAMLDKIDEFAQNPS